MKGTKTKYFLIIKIELPTSRSQRFVFHSEFSSSRDGVSLGSISDVRSMFIAPHSITFFRIASFSTVN